MVMTAGTASPAAEERQRILDRLKLEAGERLWLEEVGDSPGFAVTCYIQRWWRVARLRWATQLTLSALGTESSSIIKQYLGTIPATSLFFIPEALGFLDFVIASTSPLPHLKTIARFERALLIASEAAALLAGEETADAALELSSRIERHPAAAILEFDAPPEELLGALLLEHALPDPHEQKSLVLVAPGLEHLWRPATADEARIIMRCQSPVALESLLASEARQTLNELQRIRALRPSPKEID